MMNAIKLALALGLFAATAGVTTTAYADQMSGAGCQTPQDRTAQSADDPTCTTTQQGSGSGNSP